MVAAAVDDDNDDNAEVAAAAAAPALEKDTCPVSAFVNESALQLSSQD